MSQPTYRVREPRDSSYVAAPMSQRFVDRRSRAERIAAGETFTFADFYDRHRAMYQTRFTVAYETERAKR